MPPEASLTIAGTAWQPAQPRDLVQPFARVTILSVFVAMAVMAPTRNVNWDEFYFLSHVFAHLDGRLDRPLQTVFVHAFGWLSWVPGNEVDQIAVARLVMLGFFAGTCFALHRIAAVLTNRTAADIAVLAFVTSGFAVAHGTSFRADPMATCCLMGALALMMTTQMRTAHIAAVTVLAALALLVTVKSALYLPVFLAALLWRREDAGVLRRCLMAGVLALALAGVLFWAHASQITPRDGAHAAVNLGEAARVTLGGAGLLPRWPEVSLWLALSGGVVIFAFAGIWAAPSVRLRTVLALCALPLLSVVIYRNAFPYFFPFAAAPLMIAVAVGARALQGRRLWKLAVVLILVSGAAQTLRAISEGNGTQRATLTEVHRLFPEPVSYIGQNGMVSSFPRQGFFMSSWGLAGYRAAGRPVFADLIANETPPLLIANRAELHAALRPELASDTMVGLFPEDAETLRDTYVHHAGAIWLAGQEAVLKRGAALVDIPFAGRYRVESAGQVTVDGQSAAAGDVMSLDDGPLVVTGPADTQLRLIWETGAGPARHPLPETGLYAGFWRL